MVTYWYAREDRVYFLNFIVHLDLSICKLCASLLSKLSNSDKKECFGYSVVI